jgi:hypothetical protein
MGWHLLLRLLRLLDPRLLRLHKCRLRRWLLQERRLLKR